MMALTGFLAAGAVVGWVAVATLLCGLLVADENGKRAILWGIALAAWAIFGIGLLYNLIVPA